MAPGCRSGTRLPADVIMPALGMNQDIGRVVAWLRSEGETVAKGDPIMEIETDKATVEVEAPASGVLAAVSAREGDEVPVGQRVAVIVRAGETLVGAAPAEAADAAPAAGPRVHASSPPIASRPASPTKAGRVRASPLARRLAADAGVDLSAVAGSGPGGAVKAADVGRPAEPVSRSGIWSSMARRTAESWSSVPHFFLEREVEAGRLWSWHASAARGDPNVTFTDLLVRLTAACLPRHPLVNGRWDGSRTVENSEVNVGVAVAVEQGLVVPVIHRADRLTLAQVTERRRQLVDRARDGRLRLEDLQGGTFTISNLGMYAVDAFSAIVNQPQAAILAVGRIRERLVPVNGQPQVRQTLRLTLSCDHRAVDGARAAAFLTELGDLIEEPAALL
jgi:pyruvate dehydrogenase E2 component (dihydrolipoyllysine-residue acetyltransferase)